MLAATTACGAPAPARGYLSELRQGTGQAARGNSGVRGEGIPVSEFRCQSIFSEAVEIRCRAVEIRCRFIILAPKDELTPDFHRISPCGTWPIPTISARRPTSGKPQKTAKVELRASDRADQSTHRRTLTPDPGRQTVGAIGCDQWREPHHDRERGRRDRGGHVTVPGRAPPQLLGWNQPGKRGVGRQTATQPHGAEKPLASPGDHRSGLGGRPNQEQLLKAPSTAVWRHAGARSGRSSR